MPKKNTSAIEKYAAELKRMKNMFRADGSAADGDTRKLGVAIIAELLQMDAEDASGEMFGQSDVCTACKQSSRVHIGSEGKTFVSLCQDCHNELIAQLTGMDSPEDIPKKLSFKGKGGKIYNFAIDLQMFPTGKLLTATEIGKTKRKADVHGDLNADVYEMFETLKKRIKKIVSVNYIDKDGYFTKNSKAVGYVEYCDKRDACNVIIDGKPYTWDELEKNLSAHEGWKIKIEFASRGDELV